MLHHRKAVRQMQFMREIVDRLRLGLKSYVETGQESFPIYYKEDSYWLQNANVYDLDYDEILADVVRTLDKGMTEIEELRTLNLDLKDRLREKTK
jgi:hypothetical protein